MKFRSIGRTVGFLGLILLVLSAAGIRQGWCGMLRISMTDGTSVEVAYFWEDKGEIKFELPGGVAGVPKSQVASIQEILTAREFDPQVLVERPTSENTEQRKALQELVTTKAPPKQGEPLKPEESRKALEANESAQPSNERIQGPRFNLEGDFAELVRMQGNNGLMLVMQNVLSSHSDLKNQAFTISFYDAEGHLLQKKPCEVYELEADPKTAKKIGASGRLFTVMASVKPDPKIKRYEITTARRQ
jgi:hypothetical protein